MNEARTVHDEFIETVMARVSPDDAVVEIACGSNTRVARAMASMGATEVR